MFNLLIDMESMQNYIYEESSFIYYDIYIGDEQITTKEGYPFSLELDLSEKNMAFINPQAFEGDSKELFDLVINLLKEERNFFEEELNSPLSTLVVNYVDNKIWRYDGDYSHKLNLDFFNYMSKVYL